MYRPLTVILMAAMTYGASSAAEIVSPANDLVILDPQDLPISAQWQGQSMKLFALSNGKTYLYIEEQQAGGIAILDVTRPAHIKEIGLAKLDLPSSLDFGVTLNDSAVLLPFHDGRGAAVLDLRDPQHPRVSKATGLLEGDAEPIGNRGLLVKTGVIRKQEITGRDYRVLDDSAPDALKVLETVRSVRQRIVNENTGTTFLLGQDGLTIIRTPVIELRYWLQSTYTN